MIKNKSKLITLIILLFILLECLYPPIRIAVDNNKATSTEEWENFGFIDPTADEENAFYRVADAIVFNSKLYVASSVSIFITEETVENKIYIQGYDGQKWENIGTPIIAEANKFNIQQISFCQKGTDELYLFYISEGCLEVSRLNLNNNSWSEVTNITDVSSDFDIVSKDEEIYITTLNQNTDIAKLYKFDGTNIITVGIFQKGNGFLGKTKVTILKDDIYISVKEPGKYTVSLYKYNPEQDKFTPIEDCEAELLTSEYEMVTVLENTTEKLYITSIQTEEKQKINTYDGTNFGQIDVTGLPNNIFILSVKSVNGELFITGLTDRKIANIYT